MIGGGTITGFEGLSWVEGSNFGDQLNLQDPGASYRDFTQVYGVGGNDTITAGWYTGWMDGGDGDDLVDGRPSHYLIEVDGGAGDDTLYSNPSYTWTVVKGGDGNDTIYAPTNIHGGAGDDVIHVVAGSAASVVSGDDGNDTIDCGKSVGNR